MAGRPPSRSTPRRSRAFDDGGASPAWCRRSSAGVNAPVTTSAGRLFDAVASLVGLRQLASFEGQAAMELEWAVDDDRGRRAIRSTLDAGAIAGDRLVASPPLVVDWEPMVARAPRRRRARHAGRRRSPRAFHNTLAEMIVAVAAAVGEPRVVLTRRLLPEPPAHRADASPGCAPPASGRTGTSACRRTTAASRSGRSPRSRAASTHRRSALDRRSRTTSHGCATRLLSEEFHHVSGHSRPDPRRSTATTPSCAAAGSTSPASSSA